MSRLSDLLEAVVAAPGDDAPRRVYADALLEEADPLGEFIHVQCDLAAGGLTREEGLERRRREKELLAAHEPRWTAGLRSAFHEPRFVRGFVDELVVGADAWSARGHELFERAPLLRAITLTDLHESAADHGGPEATEALVMGRFKRAIASPLLRRLRGFGYYSVGYGYRESQWDTYDVTSFGSQTLELLLAADVSQLTALSLNANSEEAVRMLAAAPLVKNLERLELQLIASYGAAAPSPVLAALDPAKLKLLAMEEWHEGLSRFPQLQELKIIGSTRPVAHVPPALRRLWCRNQKLTRADVEALSACAELEQLELITDQLPGWPALEQARFRQLRHLWLHCRELTMDHWRQLRRWPLAEHLELLQVPEMNELELEELRELFGCIVEVRR